MIFGFQPVNFPRNGTVCDLLFDGGERIIRDVSPILNSQLTLAIKFLSLKKMTGGHGPPIEVGSTCNLHKWKGSVGAEIKLPDQRFSWKASFWGFHVDIWGRKFDHKDHLVFERVRIRRCSFRNGDCHVGQFKLHDPSTDLPSWHSIIGCWSKGNWSSSTLWFLVN